MANLSTYGFIGYEDLADERVVDGNVAMVNTAVNASLEEHNRQVSAALAELVEPTTDYTTRYKIGGGGTLQPLDEWGNPLPVRDAGYYDVAFPIQGGGTAFGDNRISRAHMTVQELERFTADAMRQVALLPQTVVQPQPQPQLATDNSRVVEATQPATVEERIRALAALGMNRNDISRQVFGHKDGGTMDHIRAVLGPVQE
jgi:hypothetical protein